MADREFGEVAATMEEWRFAAHPTYPNGSVDLVRITPGGSPFSDATVGTGLQFNSFGGGVRGGIYVSNSGRFTIENNSGSKITFSSGGNVQVSKLSILEPGSNFFPQIRMDATSGKEVGWYVPGFGDEEARLAVSRTDVLTVTPDGLDVGGSLSVSGAEVTPNVFAYAQVRNTDTTTDINTAGWTVIPFGGTVDNADAGFTTASDSITVGFDGVVSVQAAISQETVQTRTNVGIRITKNGAAVSGVGQSGYIRDASGHNNSSSHIHSVFAVASGDVIRVEGQTRGSGGTLVYQVLGESCVTVIRHA